MLCTISSAKFKIVELALCIACVVLHDMSYDFTNGPLLVLASGTFIGYLIILSGMILGEFLNNPVDLAADIFWSLAGAVLCLVVSGLMLRHNTNYTIHHLKKEFKDREILNCPADVTIDIFWMLVGSALFVTAGYCFLNHWIHVRVENCYRLKVIGRNHRRSPRPVRRFPVVGHGRDAALLSRHLPDEALGHGVGTGQGEILRHEDHICGLRDGYSTRGRRALLAHINRVRVGIK